VGERETVPKEKPKRNKKKEKKHALFDKSFLKDLFVYRWVDIGV
jgi:hypothetical protein